MNKNRKSKTENTIQFIPEKIKSGHFDNGIKKLWKSLNNKNFYL